MCSGRGSEPDKAKIPAHYKPTQILTYLRAQNSCVNNVCSDEIIRNIFLEHLSPRHKEILSVLGTVGLGALAKTADKLAEVGCSGSFVETVSQDQNKLTIHSDSESNTVQTLLEQIISSLNELKPGSRETNRAFHTTRQIRPGKFNRSRSKSRSVDKCKDKAANSLNNQLQSRDKNSLCFWHRKFLNKTNTCTKWCAKHQEWATSDRKN
ncbi:hypothetical protein PUN28_003612 [Cardiocondyla obscurior]|uniref:Uncharacterized protein n=1 Tax=Cardiocondyla obscurior TaxID=286306 RepID=A0AAW2GKA9_9HYME